MTDFKKIAQDYIDKEISVTQVDGNKRPFGNSWQERTLDKIFDPKLDWIWDATEGLGLLCGEPSGVVILDIDITDDETNEHKIRVLDELNKKLPPIFCGRTGSKNKPPARLYRYDGELNEKFKMLDIEILSTGNQAVLPPSKHPKGYNYEWVGKSLLEIEIDDLPDLDEELLVWLRRENEKLKKHSNPEDILRSVVGRCKSGSHNRLSAIGVAMRMENAAPEDIEARLILEDERINGAEDALYFKCRSRKWRSANRAENAKVFVSEICKRNKPDPKHEAHPTLKTGFFKNISEPDKKPKWVPDYNGMGKFFRDQFYVKCDDSYLSIYNEDHFKKLSKTGMLNKIHSLAMSIAQPYHLENFRKTIKAMCFFNKEDFEPPVGFVNLKNGVLDIKNKKLLKHDPKYNFKYKLKHKYQPGATSPKFEEYLDFVFSGDKQLKLLVGEIMGYTLLGGPPTAQRAFVLYGDGRNGKSTLLDVIMDLIGHESFSAIPMEDINKPFSAIRMDGKLANIVEESPTSINPEAFKNIVGGGYVSAANKGMDEFKLKVNCRMFFACNTFPHFKDGSIAIKDRLVFLPFLRYIKPEERDSTIGPSILAEMSGVLNFALEGLERWQKNGFSKSKAAEDTIESYLEESDSVRSWFNENVDVIFDDPSVETLTSDLFGDYKELCKDNEQRPVSFNSFSKRLKRVVDDKVGSEISAESLNIRVGSGINRNKRAYKMLRLIAPRQGNNRIHRYKDLR